MSRFVGEENLVVLALPRGGVPVAYEVALRVHAPLDVFLVRKLGVPGHEELAMGAIASGGVRVLNPEIISILGISEAAIAAVATAEQRELERRERLYRGDRQPIEVKGKTVILVDDGLATGSSMSAAIQGIRQHEPGRVIVGVPIASPSTCRELSASVDEIICAATPEPFMAVGLWYSDFGQTSDAEVRALLDEARRVVHADPAAESRVGTYPTGM